MDLAVIVPSAVAPVVCAELAGADRVAVAWVPLALVANEAVLVEAVAEEPFGPTLEPCPVETDAPEDGAPPEAALFALAAPRAALATAPGIESSWLEAAAAALAAAAVSAALLPVAVICRVVTVFEVLRELEAADAACSCSDG